jgi:hypothetical protein
VLLRLVKGDPTQEARVREILAAARSYIDDYSTSTSGPGTSRFRSRASASTDKTRVDLAPSLCRQSRWRTSSTSAGA